MNQVSIPMTCETKQGLEFLCQNWFGVGLEKVAEIGLETMLGLIPADLRQGRHGVDLCEDPTLRTGMEVHLKTEMAARRPKFFRCMPLAGGRPGQTLRAVWTDTYFSEGEDLSACESCERKPTADDEVAALLLQDMTKQKATDTICDSYADFCVGVSWAIAELRKQGLLG
jgi:hypothetical protein